MVPLPEHNCGALFVRANEPVGLKKEPTEHRSTGLFRERFPYYLAGSRPVGANPVKERAPRFNAKDPSDKKEPKEKHEPEEEQH